LAVAVFNYAQFIARYPEFANVNQARLGVLFVEAGFYLPNTDCSPVSDVNLRGALLNMLTAHISFMAGDLSADGQPRPVGRMSQAAEGSVSAGFDYMAPEPGSGPWYQQSQYGAAFWGATMNLRGARYVPSERRRY
jgi:hypothetical protein